MKVSISYMFSTGTQESEMISKRVSICLIFHKKRSNQKKNKRQLLAGLKMETLNSMIASSDTDLQPTLFSKDLISLSKGEKKLESLEEQVLERVLSA